MTIPQGCEGPEGNKCTLVPAFSLVFSMCSIDVHYTNEKITWLMNLKGLIYRKFVKWSISVAQKQNIQIISFCVHTDTSDMKNEAFLPLWEIT